MTARRCDGATDWSFSTARPPRFCGASRLKLLAEPAAVVVSFRPVLAVARPPPNATVTVSVAAMHIVFRLIVMLLFCSTARCGWLVRSDRDCLELEIANGD